MSEHVAIHQKIKYIKSVTVVQQTATKDDAIPVVKKYVNIVYDYLKNKKLPENNHNLDAKCFWYLGYHMLVSKDKEETENGILFLKTGSLLNDLSCTEQLANNYIIQKDIPLMIKYCELAIKFGTNVMPIYSNLCHHYVHNKKIDNALRIHELSLKKNYYSTYTQISHHYQCINIDHELTEKYLLLGIEHGFPISMFNYGVYQREIKKNNELAQKYFKMALDNKYFNAAYCYAFSIEKDNLDEANKYYLLYINNTKDTIPAANIIHLLSLENYEIFDALYENKIDMKHILASNKTTYVKYGSMRQIIKNKMKTLSKVGNCPICLQDNVTVIPADCCLHFYCQGCILRLKKCAECMISVEYKIEKKDESVIA